MINKGFDYDKNQHKPVQTIAPSQMWWKTTQMAGQISKGNRVLKADREPYNNES